LPSVPLRRLLHSFTMPIPPILCIVGSSGSGKTTLLEHLVPALSAGGLKVGIIKHASSGPDVELHSGKDSSRLAAVGQNAPVVASGPNGLIVLQPTRQAQLIDLAAAFCADCDLVLAEGYKYSPHDKIFVLPAGKAAVTEPIATLPAVRLVVGEGKDLPGGALNRNDIAALAAWVQLWLDRHRRLGRGIIGTIMAGGLSRRMGADKAAIRIGRRPLLADLAELLGGWLGEVWVIGRAQPAAGMPLCVCHHLDMLVGCGPLGGIATALRIAGAQAPHEADSNDLIPPRAVLAVACDMPAMGGELIELLLEGRRADRPATALRISGAPRPEPLAAVYEPHILKRVEQALAAGAFSATDLLESVGAHVVEVPAGLAGQLANVNTPEELGRFRRKK